MPYELRDMTGSLWKNTEKRQGKEDADMTGSLKINGQEYWLNAWLKTSEKKGKWLSVSVKPKRAPTRKVESWSVELEDDISF